ncbi:HAMP domain-containing protein [Paraburkholderia sp. CNPSo 3157]|uniref:HAMP domain-containing protein n=1 Tax=Paraburkholderia franconis TaxID=2654983 RepID=A0A7X1NIG2_9BURK|nr:methyl-accepting chemotaxis protein [Paraburkholderia franconis]MPW22236.1 HAMP domain-containing protein [Paraburkholderia franconis]
MFSRLSISSRLSAVMGVLGVLILAIGMLGQLGIERSNDALDYAYSNQLAASIAVGRANLELEIARVVLDRALMHPEAPDVVEAVAKALGHLSDSDRAWRTYRAIPLAPDEQVLANRVDEARSALAQRGIVPLANALKRGDRETADSIATKTMSPLSTVLSTTTDALDHWKNEHGKQVFTVAQQFNARLRLAGMALIAFGLIVCVGCAYGLRRSIAVPLASLLAALQRIARGDLTVPLKARTRDEMGQIVDGLEQMQGGLEATVRQVTRGAEAIAAATRQIAAGNNDLSQRTEEQAMSLQQTAASMEQLTATVRQNADNARTAQTLTESAHNRSARGSQVVSDVVNTMTEIDSSSQKIGEITGVIEGIAFQTNILALNAAVEAARAGDHGRGFAVVALEVRSLAQRAGTAAKEIKTLIDDSAERVASGSKLVKVAGETMLEISDSISRVATIMREITNASDEQRDGIEQVSVAVSQMDQVSQQNAALVEEAAATAASLDDQANVLRDAVSIFRLN